MRNIRLLLLLTILLFPCISVNAEDIFLQSGKKITGTAAAENEYNYYGIKATASNYIAITVKTTNKENLIFDICDENKEVIASEVSVPNKGTVYHKATKGKTYFLRVKGVVGSTHTISYKMKDITAPKYAKKYNYTFTNASFMNENSAAFVKIKAGYAGILQLMFTTNNEVNVKFVDKNKKTNLSGIIATKDHAFAGIGTRANKTVYAKIWNAQGTNVGVTSIKGLKYQIRSVGTSNGGSKGSARSLVKGRYLETFVPAGKNITSWYKVKVSKKQKVSFTIESRMLQNKGKKLHLYICNSSGKKLNSDPIVIDGETTVVYKKKYKMEYPVKTFGTTAKFPEGTYYIKVESKTKTSSGAYRIKWE